MQTLLNNPKITVVCPQGSLNASNALEFERDLIAALSVDGCDILQVSLKDLESLDSAGLMALVSALKMAQKLGRGFSLCSISPSMKIIFELTQLNTVFDIVNVQETSTVV